MEGICEGCNEEAEAVIVDNGIGHYEFWGAKCFDSQEDAVSKCCEAPISATDTGNFITVYDIKDEVECMRADYYEGLAEDRKLSPEDYD